MEGREAGPEDYDLWYWYLLWAASAEAEAEQQMSEARKSGW